MTLWVSPGINADHMHVVEGRACLVDPVPSPSAVFAPQTERWHPVDMEADGKFVFGEQELTGNKFPAVGEEVGLHWE